MDTLPSLVLPEFQIKTPESIAKDQFNNYAFHLALNIGSQIDLVLHPEFAKAKGKLIEKVGDEEADRIMSDFFTDNRSLFNKKK